MTKKIATGIYIKLMVDIYWNDVQKKWEQELISSWDFMPKSGIYDKGS